MKLYNLYEKITLIASLLILSNLIGQDSIGTGLFNEDLISFLRENYKTNTTLGYNNARDTLYSVIDIQDGQVKGIYTNFSVNLPSDVDPSTYLYENGINCEHVWPQSMYNGTSPMKSDMHHLKPCKSNVNSSRGNKPFNEVPDSQDRRGCPLQEVQPVFPRCADRVFGRHCALVDCGRDLVSRWWARNPWLLIQAEQNDRRSKWRKWEVA